MPRRVQDIIPGDRRSIKEVSSPNRPVIRNIRSKTKNLEEGSEIEKKENIVLPRTMREKSLANGDNVEENITPVSTYSNLSPRRMPITPPPEKRPRRRFNKWLVISLILIIAIAIAGYVASVYYSRATFTITPKVIPLNINGTYVAQNSNQNSGLFYEVITLSSSATTTVPSTNGPVTNTKASGKVVLNNAYSTQSVRLIAGTRLSSQNGLIYRLSSSVVIPGYTKSGSTIVPGKIAVNIIADQPGQDYNIPLTSSPENFKVVAYAGSARYSSIYALQSVALSGGYLGAKKIIAPAELASSTENLKSRLSEELIAKAKSSVPNGFIMYDKNYVINFGSPTIGGNSLNSADVSLKGTINAIILPKNKLAESLAGSQAIALFEPFSYTSPGLESLNVSINNIKDFSANKKLALVLNVKGNMKVVGTVPVEELKNKLAGIPLAQTQEVFRSYGAVIEKSEGELAPPWANIPSDIGRIKITVEEP